VLRKQPELTILILDGTGTVTDLHSLGELPRLNTLFLGLTGTVSLSGLRLPPSLRSLTVLKVDATTDLSAMADCPDVKLLQLFGANGGLPRGVDALSEMASLRQLVLNHIDVAAWMALAPFPPPALTRLTLQKCVLPDDPSALNFPGVEVDIS
jgi:hypothetical protein